MKFKTIHEGEEAVIFNVTGEGRHVKGPSRVFLFRETLLMLKHYTASQYEYLVVEHTTGHVIHLPGPCEIFMNPLEHRSITVCQATKIDSNHIVVVYKKIKDNSVERRIVQGPTVFVPQAEEWLHEFKWHGSDLEKLGRMIPDWVKFKKLAVIPDQFYYNVNEVRTTDDTMITVKLMIFYELKDIIKMLEQTHDPIADMIKFESFLSKGKELNSLDVYEQLQQRSEKIGYLVTKVVYRGYHSSEKLQAMQDSAMQSRTNMRLNSELQDQKQKLLDFKLQKEQSRAKMGQEMEKMKLEHQQKLNKMEQVHELHLENLTHKLELEMKDRETKFILELKERSNEYQSEHLENLNKLDVDLTQLLINKQDPPVDQEIHVTNNLSNRKISNNA